MNQNLSETSTRILSDINNNVMQLTVPTVFLDKTTKAAAKQAKEEFLQKRQDVKGSIANINAILRTINIELQYEQDQKTFTVLTQQRVIFEKILTQKQTEQINSLRTVENEIISQLQKQINNLKKSMKNKFNLILKTIEIKNQTQSQIQSQIQTENQSQNQSQIQSSNQSQNQTKTYAQIAATNIEEDNLQQTKKQQKQQEKEKEKEKYREKRLIIQIEKETAEDFDSYILRN
jgi:hypothetical protein